VASKKMADGGLPVIARFEVRHRNYLAPDGSINRPLPAFASDASLLASLYRAMVLLRNFDRKAVALQRTGRLGTYAVSLGQEAVSVGIASAMREEDVLLPSYRDNGALIWRGVKLEGTSGAITSPDRFRISRFAFPWDRRRRTPLALPMPSSCASSRVSPYACSAMAPRRRGMSTKR
jgi:hypothetical protein